MKTFTEWMRAVNAHLEAMFGLDALDLPDWDYAEAHDYGMAPKAAARLAARAAGAY